MEDLNLPCYNNTTLYGHTPVLETGTDTKSLRAYSIGGQLSPVHRSKSHDNINSRKLCREFTKPTAVHNEEFTEGTTSTTSREFSRFHPYMLPPIARLMSGAPNVVVTIEDSGDSYCNEISIATTDQNKLKELKGGEFPKQLPYPPQMYDHLLHVMDNAAIKNENSCFELSESYVNMNIQ